MVQWYYCDVTGQQKGPVADTALMAEFASGQLTADGLIWNEGLQDWTALNQVDVIWSQIQAKTPPPGPAKGLKTKPSAAVTKATTAAPAAPAAAPAPATTTAAKAPEAPKKTVAAPAAAVAAPKPPASPARTNLVDEMAKKALTKAMPKVAEKAAWKKVVGADGYPYYINIATDETTWDKPDDFVDEDEAPVEPKVEEEEKQPASAVPMLKKQASTTTAFSKSPAISPKPAVDGSAELKSAIDKLTSDLEKQGAEIKSLTKANEKAQADQSKELADVRKQLETALSKLKQVSDTVTELEGTSRANFKLVKTFAKTLTDGIN